MQVTFGDIDDLTKGKYIWAYAGLLLVTSLDPTEMFTRLRKAFILGLYSSRHKWSLVTSCLIVSQEKGKACMAR